MLERHHFVYAWMVGAAWSVGSDAVVGKGGGVSAATFEDGESRGVAWEGRLHSGLERRRNVGIDGQEVEE